MELTQPSVVLIALGVAVAIALLVWRGRQRRPTGEDAEARYRRDAQALRRGRKVRLAGAGYGDVWSAGAESDGPQSRAKKTTAWVAIGSTGGCGGCGGCGG